MSALLAGFTDPRLASILGWTLVHFLWQGALVALGMALGLVLCRTPQGRHRASCLALLACLVLPIATGLRQMHATRRCAQSLAERPMVDLHLVGPEWFLSEQSSMQARIESAIRPQLSRISLIWAVGCLLMALRMGSGCFWVRRRRTCAAPAPEVWLKRMDVLAGRMKLSRNRILLWIDSGPVSLASPVVTGFWKPVVLVPAALFTGLPADLLEALLAHELAHIQRGDQFLNLLQSCIEVVLFYHPAVWWISHRIRIEREILADERAARALGEPRRLALALNALDDLQASTPTPAALLAARGGHLMNRIQHLLHPIPPTSKGNGTWLMALLAGLLLLAPVAAKAAHAATDDSAIYVPAHLAERMDVLAKQENIDPDLLRSIAWTESHFNTQAVSSMGAKGILQVIPETAQRFGAQDLDDADQVARAGARYLRHLLDYYHGDLAKAVSAYNGGKGAVDRGQLSDETRAYTPRVLALMKAKAVRPDTPEMPSIAQGEIRTLASGPYSYELRLMTLVKDGFKAQVLQGTTDVQSTLCMIGAKDDPPSTTRALSFPVLRFNHPAGVPFRIRIAEGAGVGAWNEVVLNLDGDRAVFRMTLDRPAIH